MLVELVEFSFLAEDGIGVLLPFYHANDDVNFT